MWFFIKTSNLNWLLGEEIFTILPSKRASSFPGILNLMFIWNPTREYNFGYTSFVDLVLVCKKDIFKMSSKTNMSTAAGTHEINTCFIFVSGVKAIIFLYFLNYWQNQLVLLSEETKHCCNHSKVYSNGWEIISFFIERHRVSKSLNQNPFCFLFLSSFMLLIFLL